MGEASNIFTYPVLCTVPAVPLMLVWELLSFLFYPTHGMPIELVIHTVSLFLLLNHAAAVTQHATVIPLIVQQVNYGAEIDFERWCLCWSITNDRAAIRIFGGGVEISAAFLTKLAWATGAVFAFGASQLSRMNSGA